jgi:hypothetical protein
LLKDIADEFGEIRMENAVVIHSVTKIVKNQTKTGLKQLLLDHQHKPPHPFIPNKKVVHPTWGLILRFFTLSDVFKLQGISVEFWCMVNPSSDTCLLNLKEQFGIQTKRPVNCYGSLVFIL